MRNRSEIVGAVDFGSREVRVVVARKDDDGSIQIVGQGTAPGLGCVSQGVIQDLNAAIESTHDMHAWNLEMQSG